MILTTEAPVTYVQPKSRLRLAQSRTHNVPRSAASGGTRLSATLSENANLSFTKGNYCQQPFRRTLFFAW